ncbi:unnamed protein product [Caenorhabditis sp. 36 PRJEB53466]|nr:unnamed protein product [Caenorhabditis sp. 36 PRJEB53466]
MTSSQVIIVSVIICLTFLNFMLWSKTNYGYNPQVRQMYDSLLSRNESETSVEHTLAAIQKRLDSEMQLLQTIGSRIESFDALFANMKAYSIKQVPLRQRSLGQVFKGDQFALLYGSLASEVFCPEKVRIGTIGDGGKWTCNPWKVPDQSVLFSLGLNNYIGFEMDWQRILSNRSVLFGFDVDEQSEGTKKVYAGLRGKSKKAKIAPETNAEEGEYTIADLAKDANVSVVEILKIDIEGAEKTCLIPFLEKFQVCQIYLEVHGGSKEHANLLQKIAHLEYRLFSYEVNGFDMKACEYSFIHESCLGKYAVKPIAYYLDFMNPTDL